MANLKTHYEMRAAGYRELEQRYTTEGKTRLAGLSAARASEFEASANAAPAPAERQEIVVVRDMYAPYAVYMATFGDYDLDCMMGTGPTPLAAIVDLLDMAEG